MMLGMAFGGAGSLLSGANLLKVGFMAASAAGMYLLNGKKEKGQVARLDDLKVSSSAYGRGIPLVYGTMRVTGNMFWATDFEETLKHINSKGKGGKKGDKKGTPYYEYHANFAMALCEGPVEEILRIWADSNLIYDKHNPDNEDLVEVGFSQEEGNGGGKSGFGMGKKKGSQGGDSGRFQFRFYSGTESQMQDPFMVEKQGADLVPAHRGLCYLFFEHFALADFGNRTPTITCEVAVRKKQSVQYNVLENMDPYLVKGTTSFMDPERYRLYSVTQGSINGTRVQVYDVSAATEVRRLTFDEINAINADVPPITKYLVHDVTTGPFPWAIGNILGVAGNGDVVVRPTTGVQSYPISFLDPNTFHEKLRFGRADYNFGNGINNVTLPMNCSPTAYEEVTSSLTGQVEMKTKRGTIVQSWYGWFYIFGQDNEPLTYFHVDGQSFISGTPPLAYGPPGPNGGTFYFKGDSGELYELTWTIGFGLGTSVPDLSMASTTGVKIIRDFDVSPTFSVDYQGMQYLFGAERLVWLEVISNSLVAAENGVWAVKYNPKTNAIEWRELVSSDPSTAPGTSRLTAPINSSNLVCWFSGSYQAGTVYIVDFVSEDIRYYTTRQNFYAGGEQIFWAARGAILTTIFDSTDNEYKWALLLVDRNDQVPADVQAIITDVAVRVGIPTSRLNFSAFNSDTIKGYLIENPTNARGVVEDLAQVFMFDAVESDYSLKFVSRGNEGIVTVPQRDLGVIDDDTGDYFIETVTQAVDLPQTVVVSYINPDKDYQVGARHYRRPRSPMPVMQSREKLDINLPMALTGDEAKQLAHKVCMTLWTERTTYDVKLPWTYLKYDPTDVMTFSMDNGYTFEARMMRMDVGADFTIEATGTAQAPAAYVSVAQAQGDGGVIRLQTNFIPQVRGFAANVPYLEDEDDVGQGNFAYYWGVGAYGVGYRGAVVEYKLTGLDWTLLDVAAEEIVWGNVIGTVPEPPHGPFATDDTSVITLAPAYAYDTPQGLLYGWESIPDSNWPSTQNTIIIGEEIIYYKTAAIQADGNIKISTLIRGARGTEDAAYRHTANERFSINSTGLQQKSSPFLYMNKPWTFKAYSSLATLTPFYEDVTMEAASHKPYAPVNFTRSGATDITITWVRRTRLGGDMRDGTAVIPLNEESELYEVYLLDAPYDPDTFDAATPATYVRAYTGLTSATLTYTTAQQSTDGFVSADPVHLVGFQVSAVAGRGFPGYATLYPSILT